MKLSTFNFKYKNKTYSIQVKECKTILQKTTGLMFRKKSPALLFLYTKPKKQAIHSFFCIPFIAIWFNKNKIIKIKLVKPSNPSIKPKEKFDKLLEIPKNNKQFSEILKEITSSKN